ncbi:MAG: GNAT family N-acetyltransferase [Chitinophagaceae bacterium]
MPDILLRLAAPQDAEQLAAVLTTLINDIPHYNALAKQHETSRYSPAALLTKINDDRYAVIIAHMGDAIVGFCLSRFDDYTIWLEWFGVIAANRGKGITRQLLNKLEESVAERSCHKIWCDCRTTNQAAIHLLTGAGYAQLATIRNHWYGQDFILWEKFTGERKQ